MNEEYIFPKSLETALEYVHEALIGSRRNGKTTKMIEWLHEHKDTGAVYLVRNRIEAKRIEGLINDDLRGEPHNIKVLTIAQLVEGRARGYFGLKNFIADPDAITSILSQTLSGVQPLNRRLRSLENELATVGQREEELQCRVLDLEFELAEARKYRWKFWKKI